jgi:toxin ParE2
VTTVRYHPAAEDELLNEIGFLELRAAGLGRRFFGEIQRAERLVAQLPESGYELSSGIRKCRLRKFPFSLIYSMEKEGLLILAVAHHRRRPGYWADRLGVTGR